MDNKAFLHFSFSNFPLIILFCLSTVSCSSGLYESFLSERSSQIIKSDNDQRQYQRILLSNNLDVLLISDPTTDKAAAALDLYVGSYQNPPQREGLAHFLEHMLFLGTKQYPQPDAYQTFISEHGGRHNASTGLEHTNYFFDVNADYLSDTLDRFAPFFTDPLFDENFVDRERNAVESEYQLKYKSDGRRQWDVLREIANPNHPLSKFNVGNLETLSDSEYSNVRDELIDFYDKYYSANLMKLAVLGKEPISELDAMVREKFSSIENKQLDIQGYQSGYFKASELPIKVNIRPLKDNRELGLLFELPNLSPYWASKPANYLASMIGYEGRGSLLQALKEKGWANSLSAGLVMEDRSAGLFSINIGLTPEGYKARNQILVELFSWINLIKNHGIESWRHHEYAAMGDIAFRYSEKQAPASYVTSIARRMHQYKGEELLRGPYVTEKFDGEIIRQLAERLTPANMVAFMVSPDVEVAKDSKYYQTAYLSTPFDQNAVQKIAADKSILNLSLTGKNSFIPQNLNLIKTTSYSKPVLYSQTSGLRVWHFPNTEFSVPKSDISILLTSDKTISLAGFSKANLYVAYVLDQLNDALYPALMAGLNYTISASKHGLLIEVGGYSDKQDLLLQKLLSVLAAPAWDEGRFEVVKQQLIRDKKNSQRDYPFRQIISYLYSIIDGRWMAVDQANELEQVDIRGLQRFASELFIDIKGEVFVGGNHNSVSLEKIIKHLDIIEFKNIDAANSVAKLGEYDSRRSLSVDHNDAVLIQYIQADRDNIEERAVTSLISQMISAPFYNSIRTQKQLGYVVSAFPFHINRVPGICMIAQSPVATASELLLEFNKFNQDFTKQVDQLSLEQLEKHKAALLVNLEKAPNNLSEYNAWHLKSLNLGYESFDYRIQFANAIRALSIAQVQSGYHRLIIDKPRRLWVQTQDKGSINSQPDAQGLINQSYMFPN